MADSKGLYNEMCEGEKEALHVPTSEMKAPGRAGKPGAPRSLQRPAPRKLEHDVHCCSKLLFFSISRIIQESVNIMSLFHAVCPSPYRYTTPSTSQNNYLPKNLFQNIQQT